MPNATHRWACAPLELWTSGLFPPGISSFGGLTMHVLMLGWEFPPFISGGLGTACHGLTKALDRRNVDVTFVLPKPIDRSHASHVSLLSPDPASPDTPLEPIARLSRAVDEAAATGGAMPTPSAMVRLGQP